MATAYLPAGRIPANDQNRRVDDDAFYWKRLQQLAVFQEPGTVSSVDFSSRKPYLVACTSSVRMTLYDSVVCEPTNLSGRFKQTVYGVRFRKDGNLVAIGGEEGKIRVFDVDRNSGTGKTPLRSLRACQTIVRAVEFPASGRSIFSMSDDGMLRLWDLASALSKPLSEVSAHHDSIRTGAASSTNDNLVITGGYDHKIRLWDMRTAPSSFKASVEMDAGAPVEKVLFLHSENLIATASGPIVKIWDLSAGGRQLVSMQHHHRTVTALCLGAKGGALLSGAIDRRINVFNISDFSLIHSMSMPSPVMGLAMSPDDQTMAVGMGNLLALHRRAAVKKELIAVGSADTRSVLRTAAPQVLTQEKGKEKVKKEIVARSHHMLKLHQIDHELKAYNHGKAIQKIFGTKYHVKSRQEQVVGWLRQLVHRRVIRAALSGQETHVQMTLLKFLYTQMFKNNYFDILRHVAEAFFEVYSDEEVDERVCGMMIKLKDSIGRELAVQKQLCQTIGALEMILSTGRVEKLEDDGDSDDVFGEPVISSVPLVLEKIEKKQLDSEGEDESTDDDEKSEDDDVMQQ